MMARLTVASRRGAKRIGNVGATIVCAVGGPGGLSEPMQEPPTVVRVRPSCEYTPGHFSCPSPSQKTRKCVSPWPLPLPSSSSARLSSSPQQVTNFSHTSCDFSVAARRGIVCELHNQLGLTRICIGNQSLATMAQSSP